VNVLFIIFICIIIIFAVVCLLFMRFFYIARIRVLTFPSPGVKKILYILGEHKILHDYFYEQNFSTDELLIDSESKEKALEMLLDYCELYSKTKKLMNNYNISRDDLEKFYWNLLKLGAGQWVGDFYVAGAAIIYPTTLYYIIKNQNNINEELAYNLIIYFEQREEQNEKLITKYSCY
jgi:hypothetical protein